GRRIVGGERSNRKVGRGKEDWLRQRVDDIAFTPCAIQEERSYPYNLVAGRVLDKKGQAGYACHECLKLIMCRQGTGQYEIERNKCIQAGTNIEFTSLALGWQGTKTQTTPCREWKRFDDRWHTRRPRRWVEAAPSTIVQTGKYVDCKTDEWEIV